MNDFQKYFLNNVSFNYSNFDGRATRKEYWMYCFFFNLLILILAIINPIIAVLFEIVLFPCSCAIITRRFHDLGWNGWTWLSIIVWPVFLIFLCLPGDRKDNRYGKNPYPQSQEINSEITKYPRKTISFSSMILIVLLSLLFLSYIGVILTK